MVLAAAGSTRCLPIPFHLLSSGESLEMVWPKRLHSTGDCVCPPYEGSRMQFSDCAKSCNTEYSISILDNEAAACFSKLTIEQNGTPVYFTVVRAVPCLGGEDETIKKCYIRRIATSYSILVSGIPGIIKVVYS